MNKLITIFLSFLLVFGVVFAQTDIPEGGVDNFDDITITKETARQRLERMLLAFENENLKNGFLAVSFNESIEIGEAVLILENFGLDISETQVCGPETVSPDNESGEAEDINCEMMKSWDDSLKTAVVEVVVGKEKATAEELIRNKDIVWVEPLYEVIPADLNADAVAELPDTENSGQKISNSFLISIFAIIFVIASVVLIRSGKNRN